MLNGNHHDDLREDMPLKGHSNSNVNGKSDGCTKCCTCGGRIANATGNGGSSAVDSHPSSSVNMGGTGAAQQQQQQQQHRGERPIAVVVKERLSVLVTLLLLQSGSQVILENYEGLITANVIIPLFLTMLVGAGGNAGNQAAVQSITGIVTGEYRLQSWMRVLKREAIIGLVCASVLFGISFLRVQYFYMNEETITTGWFETLFAISASLFLIVIISVVLGSLLPFGLLMLGVHIEHAAPMIQVAMDILGVLISCVVCSIFLPSTVPGGPTTAPAGSTGHLPAAATTAVKSRIMTTGAPASGGPRGRAVQPLWIRTRDNVMMERCMYRSNNINGITDTPDHQAQGVDGSGSVVDRSINKVHLALIDSSLKARMATLHGQLGPRCTFLDCTRFVSLLLSRAQPAGLTTPQPPRSDRRTGMGSDSNKEDNIPLPSDALRQMFRRSIENDADVLALLRSLHQQLAAAGCSTLSQRAAVGGKRKLSIPRDCFSQFLKEVVRGFLGPTILELLDQISVHAPEPDRISAFNNVGKGGNNGDGDGYIYRAEEGDNDEPLIIDADTNPGVAPSEDPDIDTGSTVTGGNIIVGGITTYSSAAAPTGAGGGAAAAGSSTFKQAVPLAIASGEWTVMRAHIAPARRYTGPKKSDTAHRVRGGVEEADFIRRLVDMSLLANSEEWALPGNLKERVMQFLSQVCVPAVREVLKTHGLVTATSQPQPPLKTAGVQPAPAILERPTEPSALQLEGHRGRHMTPLEVSRPQLQTAGQSLSPRTAAAKGVSTQPSNAVNAKVIVATKLPQLPSGVQQPHSQMLKSLGSTASSNMQYQLQLQTTPRGVVETRTAADAELHGEDALEVDQHYIANCGTTLGLQPLETTPGAAKEHQKKISGRIAGTGQIGRVYNTSWRRPTKTTASSLAQRAERWKERGLHPAPPNQGSVGYDGTFREDDAGTSSGGKVLVTSVVHEKTALGRRVRLAELFPIGGNVVQMDFNPPPPQ